MITREWREWYGLPVARLVSPSLPGGLTVPATARNGLFPAQQLGRAGERGGGREDELGCHRLRPTEETTGLPSSAKPAKPRAFEGLFTCEPVAEFIIVGASPFHAQTQWPRRLGGGFRDFLEI